ncbi:MAG: YARHG domain-containing protein [Bacteroidales bacterium]|nr:YARHG domain-containing protein [Bacteroidales bacterium]
MKRIISLIAAIITTASVANAQIDKGSIWYSGNSKLVCESVSGNTYKCHFDFWGDDEESITFTLTSPNNYSVKGEGEYSFVARTPKAEYREFNGSKLLLMKDDNGNILKHYVRTDDEMWEPQILKGYWQIIEGEYVDEQGTKYTFGSEELKIGNKESFYSIDPENYCLMRVDDLVTYWWRVSTTGINIYKTTDSEYGLVPGKLWHKLRNVSPNGRWAFLSSEIVENNAMWRFHSGLIRLMRNEIFARHGYEFSSDDLKTYFESQPWYKCIHNNAAVNLNEVEKFNVELLKGNIAAREGTDDEEIEEGL